MKSILIDLSFLISLTMGVAVPEEKGWQLRSADEVKNENIRAVDLTVTDSERFPGKTFKGTAKSIYLEMKALKPEYFANETESIATSLAKRQGAPIDCNWGGRIGRWYQCVEGIEYLTRLGTAKCGVKPQPECARVSCSHYCGMYLCNKLDHELHVHCVDIAHDINAIASECINAFGNVHGRRDFWSHFIGLGQDKC